MLCYDNRRKVGEKDPNGGKNMAFFAELIITVVKMVFLMAVAVLGVKAGHALLVRKEKK